MMSGLQKTTSFQQYTQELTNQVKQFFGVDTYFVKDKKFDKVYSIIIKNLKLINENNITYKDIFKYRNNSGTSYAENVVKGTIVTVHGNLSLNNGTKIIYKNSEWKMKEDPITVEGTEINRNCIENGKIKNNNRCRKYKSQ